MLFEICSAVMLEPIRISTSFAVWRTRGRSRYLATHPMLIATHCDRTLAKLDSSATSLAV